MGGGWRGGPLAGGDHSKLHGWDGGGEVQELGPYPSATSELSSSPKRLLWWLRFATLGVIPET